MNRNLLSLFNGEPPRGFAPWAFLILVLLLITILFGWLVIFNDADEHPVQQSGNVSTNW